jgi:hypothetical protein
MSQLHSFTAEDVVTAFETLEPFCSAVNDVLTP